MIDFSKDSIFNLKKVDDEKINKNAEKLLIEGEEIVGVYKTVRDQVIFTTKRILTIDVEGLSGKRQDIASLPYNRIQYYGVQTPGLVEVLPDAELILCFTDGMKAVFEFRGKNNILEIGRVIAQYSLK